MTFLKKSYLVFGVPLGVGTGDLAATEDLDVLADFGSGVTALGDGDLTLLRLVLGVAFGDLAGAAGDSLIVTSSSTDLTEDLEADLTEDLDVFADFGSGVTALGEGDLTLLLLVLGVVLGVPLGVTAGDFAFTEDLDVLADFGSSGSGVTALGEGDLTLLRLVLGVALGDLVGATGDSLIVTSPSTDLTEDLDADLTEDLDVFADFGSGVAALGDGDLTLLRLE